MQPPSGSVATVVGSTDIKPAQDYINLAKMMEKAREICRGTYTGSQPVYFLPGDFTSEKVLADGHHVFLAYRYLNEPVVVLPHPGGFTLSEETWNSMKKKGLVDRGWAAVNWSYAPADFDPYDDPDYDPDS